MTAPGDKESLDAVKKEHIPKLTRRPVRVKIVPASEMSSAGVLFIERH